MSNCVNELFFWINYLKKQYKKIDLYGESIGGGIVIETCKKYSINTINKIYLQSTFTSMKDVIKDMNNILYYFYRILLLDDLNTNKSLENIKCNKFVIIHSKEDDLINYNQALQNYEKLQKLNKIVKLISAYGDHNNTTFIY